ncbi:hypothetical protein B9Z19DRAFT_1153094 [Tuber borchii]|uniref:Granulins domain-containing protein n=1 Tax=Tuber borchii TaxID=42251 RepID=A0A2T6ZJC0_TUBBO|nr:hypothetical protein B9Z19DRAFT_1153094 [Tuber borchii]
MMENLAKLSLLAALTIGQSLAEDVTPYPLCNRHYQPMGDLKPRSETFNSKAVTAIEAPGLAKRQTYCPDIWFQCPNTTGCCYPGFTCIGEGENVRCQWPPTSVTCEPGFHKCTDKVGFCCPNGTECIPGTLKCWKPCDPGSTQCFDGCCEPGYTCNSSNRVCVKIMGPISISITTSAPTTSKVPASDTTLVNSFTTIPTPPKATTSGTTPVRPFTTPPIRPAPTNSDSEPTLPPTTENENSTESVKTGPSRLTTGLANCTCCALKLGGWLLGILFFFVFFDT